MLSWAIGVIVAVTVLSVLERASAQPSTNATCSASYSWASNSLQQSPCLVAAYLGSACNDGVFLVPQLGLNDHYLGPTSGNANPCQCSSVFYSLISACADCSGHLYLSWSTWDTNCATIYLSTFADDIPLGTAVPAWAYLNISTVDGYDSLLAEQDTGGPESTHTPQPTGSPSTTVPSPSFTSNPSSRKSQAGPIAGGVVGGVLLLLIAASFLLSYIKRRRERNLSHDLDDSPVNNLNEGIASATPPSMSYVGSNHFSIPDTPRLYDPSDPSTFPSVPTSPFSTTSGLYTTHHESIVPSISHSGGNYSGVAEV